MTTRRAVIACVLFVLGVVAATVVVDRVVARTVYADASGLVPTYRSFPDEILSRKLRDFDGKQAEVDTMVLGNSRTLFGLDPITMDRRLAERGVQARSYNLASLTVDTRFWPQFFRDYLDRKPVKRVLYGILPRDVDARNQAAAAYLQAFRQSPGFQNRDDPVLDRTAEEILAKLYTMRGRVNEVKSLRPAKKVVRKNNEPVNAAGWAEEFPRAQTYSPSELAAMARTDARRTDRPTELVPGRDQLRSLLALARTVHAEGGCLTLFTTPILFDREMWGTEPIRREFVSLMRRLAQRTPGVQFVDVGARLERRYGPEDFADGDHLRPAGARKFSRDLADALRARAFEGDDCGEPRSGDPVS